ncbi:hypothetical protein [Streptomyces prunicolor]|jgi:hypothetical protein|uniref:hypothetical protein n=1 Tax=Streptomyces prunicolor TaxID=67348 RepID=UPI000380F107
MPEISRRAFGGLVGGGAVTAVAGTAATAEAAESAPAERPFKARPAAPGKRPNLLVILGDDLGWADLSSYGGRSPTTGGEHPGVLRRRQRR